MIPSCKKEKEPQVLSEPTSFDVPELVHVYGGYPFTLPIVTEPEVSDISALEFEHPDKENFKLKIVDNQAVLTYVPLEENDETEGVKVRSETLRVGNEKLGYKDVVVHVASTPISAAFLLPLAVADIYDGAYLKTEGYPSGDNYRFLIGAAVHFQDIEGNVPSLTEEDLSLDITAPSGKIISDDNTYSGSGNMLALVYNKEVEGRVTIRNCTFVNGYHFAIEMGCVAGHFDIYNNVFVANRMSACEVRGMNPDQKLCSLDFHNNTVLFTWCRTKVQESMGVGFRFMTGLYQVRVYDNIFGCSNLGAIERTFVDSNSAKEAARITSATDNLFFMNRNNMTDGAADLVLPSGSGKWLFLAASQFEDAEQLKEYEGNREMAADENFINAIDPAYLKGYMGINIKSSSSYDPNSAANQVNRLFGMNQQGSEIVRASMFANRYPFEKAFELFGAVSGCGAQRP